MIRFRMKVAFAAKRFMDGMRRNKLPKGLRHAAAILRKDMRQSLSIPGRGKPSRAPLPPHKQSGRLYRSILFAMDKNDDVVIGSMPRSYGWYGKLHEHGGKTKTWVTKLMDFEIGEEAPIRIDDRGNKKSIVHKTVIKTSAQRDLANSLNRRLFHSRKINLYQHSKSEKVEKVGQLPKRPFAAPALARNLGRIPYSFRESILES